MFNYLYKSLSRREYIPVSPMPVSYQIHSFALVLSLFLNSHPVERRASVSSALIAWFLCPWIVSWELLSSHPFRDSFAIRVYACAQFFLSFSYRLDLFAEVPEVEHLHFPLIFFFLVKLFHAFVIWLECLVVSFIPSWGFLPPELGFISWVFIYLFIFCKALWVSTIVWCHVFNSSLMNRCLTTLKKANMK